VGAAIGRLPETHRLLDGDRHAADRAGHEQMVAELHDPHVSLALDLRSGRRRHAFHNFVYC